MSVCVHLSHFTGRMCLHTCVVLPEEKGIIHINNVHSLSGHHCRRHRRCLHRHRHPPLSLLVHRPYSLHLLSMKYWSSVVVIIIIFAEQKRAKKERWKLKLMSFRIHCTVRSTIYMYTLTYHGKNTGRLLCNFDACFVQSVIYQQYCMCASGVVVVVNQKSERYSQKPISVSLLLLDSLWPVFHFKPRFWPAIG